MNNQYMPISKPMEMEKYRAQIFYVLHYVMWTFWSKNAFGLQIIHQNRFKMHLEPETLVFECLYQSINISNSTRIHLCPHIAHGAQDCGFPWCIPMNKVSLNDAFLVRYISKGPTSNQYHVTAIDIIGKRNPNLDPEVFCCEIWSKIVSYLNKYEIWPKYGILSQRWLHTKLKKTSKGVFAVLSPSWRYTVCDFGG